MTREYVPFSQKKFEYELFMMKKRLGFYGYSNVTEAMVRNGYNLKEQVYMIPTKRKNTNILIYSSLDVRSNKVRTIGSDAVRVVLVRKRNDGKRYFKRLGKHLRINTLFKNLENTIAKGLKEGEQSGWFSKDDKISEGFGLGL